LTFQNTEKTKHARELVIAKARSDAANRAKSIFLAYISHEIRTLMNGDLGMATLLRHEGVTPRQAQRRDTIDPSARHLLGVIDNILELSNIEAENFVLKNIPLSISTLLANVTAILSERAEAKNIRLVIESTSLPSNLYGDPTRLQHALLNYATNAIKFTEAGTVTLRVVNLEETAESVTIRFEVQDTGIGIASETMPRLISAFELAGHSATRRCRGTGLGLAITKRLAELMGGEAGAEIRPRMGSTFWFSVRLKRMP
jgi:signal transduction histidine kinase